MEGKSNFQVFCENWIRKSGLLDSNADYEGMVGKKLLEMVAAFSSNGGNSGGSAYLTREAFNAMIDEYEGRGEGVLSEFEREEIAKEIIGEEYRNATLDNGPFHSAHEGFAVILEEVDELREEVWKKERDRDYARMEKEAKQIGAMATRFLVDIVLKKTRKAEKTQ